MHECKAATPGAPPELWSQIEVRLPEEPRRRLPLLLLWSFAGIGAALLWLLLSPGLSSTESATAASSTIEPPAPHSHSSRRPTPHIQISDQLPRHPFYSPPKYPASIEGDVAQNLPSQTNVGAQNKRRNGPNSSSAEATKSIASIPLVKHENLSTVGKSMAPAFVDESLPNDSSDNARSTALKEQMTSPQTAVAEPLPLTLLQAQQFSLIEYHNTALLSVLPVRRAAAPRFSWVVSTSAGASFMIKYVHQDFISGDNFTGSSSNLDPWPSPHEIRTYTFPDKAFSVGLQARVQHRHGLGLVLGLARVGMRDVQVSADEAVANQDADPVSRAYTVGLSEWRGSAKMSYQRRFGRLQARALAGATWQSLVLSSRDRSGFLPSAADRKLRSNKIAPSYSVELDYRLNDRWQVGPQMSYFRQSLSVQFALRYKL